MKLEICFHFNNFCWLICKYLCPSQFFFNSPVCVFHPFFLKYLLVLKSWNYVFFLMEWLHLWIVQIFNHEQVFDTDVTFSLQLLFPRLNAQSWRSPDQTIKAAMELMSSLQRRPAAHLQCRFTRNMAMIGSSITP